MNFTDTGIVLDARAHGETHAVVDVFTRAHGRWAGLVYGGQGRRMRPLLQAGNEVSLEWKGRGEETLGHFALEMAHARAGEAMGELQLRNKFYFALRGLRGGAGDLARTRGA